MDVMGHVKQPHPSGCQVDVKLKNPEDYQYD
ncbi:hypothetical protein BN435_1390 [Erwinia amylovora 01SFR-BO]|uniref:Uncharacterized protein n=1 Tax=Erwinia amylovora ATCC BAA-2158 TaxID=889211 RepID=E5B404_ERWAM|nr:hypothetical protein predicted by Glimmer/Critica [Erwinia amylovora ATCC BAA-2158]CCO89573.1 hypothetical protein BN435_1390 [Erwinia amylovora 01SFR-BO]